MSVSKNLDLAIKALETNTIDAGYVVDGRTYNTYMARDKWDAFKTSMLPSALEEFGGGSGGELVEKNGRPPKMACYGSSSRMIYMLSRNKNGFHYEKKLPTTIGGIANLDGFFEDDSRYIFVEAKCHEPYSTKSNSVSKSYERFYCFVNEHMAGNIEIAMKTSKCGRYLDVEYFSDGEKIEHFDIKQMICHLLGIATGLLKKDFVQKQIDFIYLLYDPTELNITTDIKKIVDSIYEKTCYECNLIDFAKLFQVILRYLQEEKYGEILSNDEIEKAIYSFTFVLASQKFYPILLQ